MYRFETFIMDATGSTVCYQAVFTDSDTLYLKKKRRIDILLITRYTDL